MKKYIFFIAAAFFLFSCEEQSTRNEDQLSSNKTETSKTETENEDESSSNELDESKIASIDSYRRKVENEIDKPLEIRSDQLREKTKQKWHKVHFYVEEGKVVRIKSYPHEGISERTEEFYLMDNQLVLAVIEDSGLAEREIELEEIDKVYYFNNGELIKEIGSEKESEFSIRNSDAEELLSEVKEYLNVYKEQVEEVSK